MTNKYIQEVDTFVASYSNIMENYNHKDAESPTGITEIIEVKGYPTEFFPTLFPMFRKAGIGNDKEPVCNGIHSTAADINFELLYIKFHLQNGFY
jgi:hypothetical protein